MHERPLIRAHGMVQNRRGCEVRAGNVWPARSLPGYCRRPRLPDSLPDACARRPRRMAKRGGDHRPRHAETGGGACEPAGVSCLRTLAGLGVRLKCAAAPGDPGLTSATDEPARRSRWPRVHSELGRRPSRMLPTRREMSPAPEAARRGLSPRLAGIPGGGHSLGRERVHPSPRYGLDGLGSHLCRRVSRGARTCCGSPMGRRATKRATTRLPATVEWRPISL
jgi:hypothetical protein